MKSNIVLLIALLTMQVFATKLDFTTFIELSDLKGDSYAESLVETINTALAQKGGKIEAIQDMLVDLLNKLTADQKKADAAWNKRYKALNKTIDDTTSLIEKLALEITKEKAKRANLRKLNTTGTANLKQYNAQEVGDQATLRDLMLRRKKDHSNYMDNLNQHQNLILAVETVVKTLRQLKGSISGVGKPAHVKAIAQEIRDADWKKKHPALLQVFSETELDLFIEMATEADQDALEKLIGLLHKLIRSAKKSLADDEAAESKSKKNLQST